jgi:hypothetical protein
MQLSPRIKKINHFMENQGFVYVSCDFGIVQFNLQTLLLVILTSLVIMELRS